MKPLSALIAELRKLASAATPGPYKEDLGNGTVESTHPDHYRAEVVGRADIGERASWYRQAGHGETWVLPDCDIEFVAACDPQTILRLCGAIEALKEVIEHAVYEQENEPGCGSCSFNWGLRDDLKETLTLIEKNLTPK